MSPKVEFDGPGGNCKIDIPGDIIIAHTSLGKMAIVGLGVDESVKCAALSEKRSASWGMRRGAECKLTVTANNTEESILVNGDLYLKYVFRTTEPANLHIMVNKG